MNREQLVEAAAKAIRSVGDFGPFAPNDYARAEAEAVLDAILPQVTTVAERAALPVGAVVRSTAGTIAARFDAERGVVFGMSQPFSWATLQLPLTVLWQPS